MTDAGFAGQKLHVPGFRIARLGPLPEVYPGELLPPDVLYDVMSISVTLKNSGPSTYTIVLNNNHLATGADRAARGAASSGGAGSGDASGSSGSGGSGGATATKTGGFSRERMIGSHPAWPRYKYNDLAYFEFGQRLRIDMRYWPRVEGDSESDEPQRVAYRNEWTPMISGPITDIKFDLVAGAGEKGMRITVSGHDDLSRLGDFQDWRCDLAQRSEMGALQHILEELQWNLPTAEPLVPLPPFVNRTDHGIRLARNADKTPLELLTDLAKRLDFEIFVAFDLNRAGHPLEFHFEPYRGRARPNDSRRLLIALERGKTLLHLDTTINVVDQYTSVVVRGRRPQPTDAIEAIGRTQAEDLRDEIHETPRGRVTPAPLVRTHYYRGRPNPHDPGPAEGLDDERARWRASAILRQKARELCVLKGGMIGLPRLRAGNHVQLFECRAPFDGFYYLTETVHTIDSEGYKTEFTASRPGMEIPDASHHYVETSP